MKIMYISLREMMKFMPEARRLDGNIWVWISPVWDAFAEYGMNVYRTVKEKIRVYEYAYSVAMIYSNYLSVVNGSYPHAESLYIVPDLKDVTEKDDYYQQLVSPDTDFSDFMEYLITNGEELDEMIELVISLLGIDEVYALLTKARTGSTAGAFDATADNLSAYEWLKSKY